MKRFSVKRILSALLSLMMIISSLPFTPLTASAGYWDEIVDEYEYFVSVKTTDDADGWNDASVQLFTFDDDSYDSDKVSQEKVYTIKSDIDDDGEEFRQTYKSKNFLYKLRVYIDFGGGFTWRDWAGDITLKINGVNIVSSHVTCDSSPYSSSNKNFDFYVAPSDYPYIDEDNSHFELVDACGTRSEDLTFYQSLNENNNAETKNITEGTLYAQLADQYNVGWRDASSVSIESNTHPDDDIFTFNRVEGTTALFDVKSDFGFDHTSKLTLSCPWNNHRLGSDDIFTYDFDVDFKFLHDVEVSVNKDAFATYHEYTGSKINLNEFGIADGYRIKSFTPTGPGELVDNKDNTAVFTVGNGDATLKANVVANTYYIDYDKNADDATGEMKSKLATYDSKVAFANCTYVREGYTFLEWNTKPDGSGQSFRGGASAVKPNLTTENGGHATVYAQWGKNVLTVKFVYPLETGYGEKTVYVNRGFDVEPEQYIGLDDESGHYKFTGADQKLTKISDDMTVNLSYEKEEHNYGKPFTSVEPTCTTDGIETQICTDCGYEKNTLIPAHHLDVRTEPGNPASCTTDGVETIEKCYACGEIIKNGEVLPAYGHDYNFKKADWSFTTESGTLKGYATVTCKTNKTHKVTKEAEVEKDGDIFRFTAFIEGTEVSTTIRLGKDVFEVNVNTVGNGKVTATPKYALKKDRVTLTAEHGTTSYLTDLKVESASGEIALDGESFIMPKGNVTVTATFSATASNQCGDNAFWHYDEETKTLTFYGTGAIYDYTEYNRPWRDYVEDGNVSRIVIEEGITRIGKFVFSRLGDYSVEVYIADSVTSIGASAFYYSPYVKIAHMPANLETIEDNAFYYRTGFGYRTVDTIPEKVTAIGDSAFVGMGSPDVYCYANPSNLSWGKAVNCFADNKYTKIHVYAEYLDEYNEKFGDAVNANFVGDLASLTHSITIQNVDHGTIVASNTEMHKDGTVILTYTPDKGYDISYYTVTDANGNDITVSGDTFTMPNSNVTVSGVFKELRKINTEVVSGEGTVSVSKGSASAGTKIKITPTPNEKYRTDSITVTDANGENIEVSGNTFTMPDSDVTVSVSFVPYTHTVTYSVKGNGSVSGTRYADTNDKASFTANIETGSKVKSITIIDEEGNSLDYSNKDFSNTYRVNETFTMPDSNVNVIVEFETVYHSITYHYSNGQVSGQSTAVYGEEVKLNIVPNDGYVFNGRASIGGFASFNKEKQSFIMPNQSIDVYIWFDKASSEDDSEYDGKQYSITIEGSDRGTVTAESLTVTSGTEVKLDVAANMGYHLSSLSINGGSVGWYDDYRFIMPNGDVTVKPNFYYNTYPIIYKADHGSINSSNNEGLYSISYSFTVSPDNGYRVASVSVKDIYGNDVECEKGSTWSGDYYSYVMPAGGVVITAEFEEDTYSITYNSDENVTVSGPENALVGERVTLSATTKDGYVLKNISVSTNKESVEVEADDSFIMPSADVTVTHVYSDNKCGDNAYWKYDRQNKVLTIYGSGEMYDYNFYSNISPWSDCNIDRVVIDTGISYIGQCSFANSSVQSVYMADTVKEIGNSAFSSDTALKSVRMSERLTNIDEYAFYDCTALTQIDFPSTLEKVDEFAFSNTPSMTDVYCYPDSYYQIEWAVNDSSDYPEEFKSEKQTLIHVKSSLRYLYEYYYKDKINATFVGDLYELDAYNITVENSTYGAVKADCAKAPQGRTVYVTATPIDETYTVKSITVTDSSGNDVEVVNNNYFIMPASAVTVNAEFERKSYSITHTATNHGSATCESSAVWGSTVTVDATPDTGYKLQSITVTDENGDNVEVNGNTFVMPASNVNISVKFEKLSYGITYRASANGTISGMESASYGDVVAVNVIPTDNYKLATLSVTTVDDETVAVNGTKFTMPAKPVIIKATFEMKAYKVTYVNSGSGSVSGETEANRGDIIKLTVTQDKGTELNSLTATDADGNKIEITDNAFVMPESNVTVKATFNTADYAITYNEAEHGSISGTASSHYGGRVYVTATPDKGYELDTLVMTDEDGNETQINNSILSMPASDISVTATFKKISSQIFYAKVSGGSVSGIETAEYGDTVAVTPIASSSSYFNRLEVKTLDGESVETNGTQFIMPEKPVIVFGRFDQVDYPINYSATEGGSVTGNETAHYGDEVELSVTVDTGYELASLTVTDSEGNEITVTDGKFTMPETNVNVSAVFNIIDYDITYSDTENGSISGPTTAHYGDNIELNISPDEKCRVTSLVVTDENGSEVPVSDNAFVMPASSVTVSVTIERFYAYVVYSESGSSKILTLKYGPHQPEGDDEWELPSSGRIIGRSNYGDITDVIFDPSFADARPTTTYSWFDGFKSLSNIQGLEYLNTSEVIYMHNMFYECRNLTSLDLSTFDTSKVINMREMFHWCTRLTEVDVSNFDTSKVTNFSEMFSNCSSLETLDLSTFDNSNATTTSSMFTNCAKLTTIYVEGIDTQWKVTERTFNYNVVAESIFDGCSLLVGGTGVSYSEEHNSSVEMAKVQGGYFTAKQHTVTIGEVVGGTIEADKTAAAMGETVTLTDYPENKYTSVEYSVTDSNGNEITVTDGKFTMPASDVTVTATFKKIDYTVTYVAQNGTVEGVSTATYGDKVTLTVTPNTGYEPEALTVKDSAGNEITVTDGKFTMPASNVTVTATFKKTDYTVTYVAQNGTVEGVSTATYGDEVTLTVTPDTGYELEALTAVDSDGNEITITDGKFTVPASNVTVTATFKKTDYTVTYNDVQNGTVTGVSTANYGEEVTLTVTPDTGYELEALTVKDSAGNEITVTDGKFAMPTSNVTVTATFKKIDYTVTYAAQNGTVEGASSATYGDEVTLTVTPDTGYELEALTAVDSDGNEITITDGKFTVPASNVTVTATFKKIDYTVTYVAQNGAVDGVSSATFGDEVTLTVTPDTGYELEVLTVKDSAGNEITVTDGKFAMPTSNVTVTATFKKIDYTVTYAAQNGTVEGASSATFGDEVTLTVTPDTGYELEVLTVKDSAGNEISVTDGKFTMPASNVTVTARFTLKLFTVKWIVGGEAVETDEEVPYGMAPEYNGEAPADYSDGEYRYNFIGWSDGTNTYAADELPAVTADVTYTAIFVSYKYVEKVEPYIDENGAYITGNVAYYTDENGNAYAVNEDGSVGEQLNSVELCYFDFTDISNETCTILRYTGSYENIENGELVIPKTYKGKKITVLGDGVTQNATFMAKATGERKQFVLTLNENIEEIRPYAFYGAWITKVQGDTSELKEIGIFAFSWANKPGEYAITVNLEYPGKIKSVGGMFNNMNVTLNLTHATTFSSTNFQQQSITYNFTDAHIYGKPVWTWADDYSTATATFTCTDSRCKHTETAAAQISTDEHADKIVYTATAEFEGKTYQDTKETAIPLDTDAYYAALAEAKALKETDLMQYEDSETFLAEIDGAEADFAAATTQSEVDAATARIITAIEMLKKGYIEPEYKGTCNIVGLEGVTIMTNGETEYEAQYDEKVYLLGPADSKFAYTNADGSEIYAYLVGNVLYAPKNNTIYIKAVSEVTEGKAYIAGTSFENRKAKYNCQYSVPEGATDIETGIVMSFDKATTLEIGADGARAFKAQKVGDQHEYSITFNISDPNMGKTIYGKSYLTYTLNGETFTVYSDQHNIQLKEAE